MLDVGIIEDGAVAVAAGKVVGVASSAEIMARFTSNNVIDAAGRVVYGNLAVAGGSLAGYDPIREGCLEGVAIATGWRAGAL